MLEQKHQIYGFDNFRLDVPNRHLLLDGRPVLLPAKAFDMLVVLVENGGRLVQKDELFNRVWPDQIVEESNLTVQVSAIRKALGERTGRPLYIVTVPGHGYRFAGNVTRLDEEEEELVTEHHSHSRIVVETETETGAEQGSSIALANAPASRTFGHSSAVAMTQPTGATAFQAPPVQPGVRPRRKLLLSAVAAGFVLMFGTGLVLYRQLLRKVPAVPFPQITVKRLTNNGTASNAALSPDGKLFAYTTGKSGQRSLWVGHVDGGEPIALRPPAAVNYRSLNFSPDSGRLYFVITGPDYPDGALLGMSIFGGAPEKLRDDISVKISFAPDMKQFAYVRTDHEQRESTLVIANTNGGDARRLASRPLTRPFVSSSPAWSPDGSKIALAAVSDEGDASNYEVVVVTVADGRVTELTKQTFKPILNLSWLNDDRGLVMIATEYPESDAQIWHVSVPGGEVRNINPDVYNYASTLSVSADGGSVIAIQTQTTANIWVAPAANLSQARRITFGSVGRREGVHGLGWTPDERILFPAFVDKSQMLWLMAADGSNQKQLTSAGHADNDPSITADGRFIVFQSNRSGNREIWRVNGDGSSLAQLTDGGNNEQPSVSPDGKWVVYISARDNVRALWRVPLEGGAPMRLSDGRAAWPRVSPDGQLIACEYVVPTGPPQTKLAIIPIAGGQPVKLFDLKGEVTFRYGLRWTPDGQAVTYRDWANGIWRQPLTGGEPQRLEGLPEEKLFAYGWSRDGKQFAFTRGSEIRDVVLIRNFR